MSPSTRSAFVRDTLIATGVVVVLLLLARSVQVQALQIPGYLIVVGFDLLESVFGPVRAGFEVVFGLYMVSLGLLSAGLAHGFRIVASKTALPAWRIAVAAALTLIAVIALVFGAVVYTATMQTEPVKTLGATGVVLLVVAALLMDMFDVTTQLSNAR